MPALSAFEMDRIVSAVLPITGGTVRVAEGRILGANEVFLRPNWHTIYWHTTPDRRLLVTRASQQRLFKADEKWTAESYEEGLEIILREVAWAMEQTSSKKQTSHEE